MATKYAFKMTTREGTYFVDSETGEFLDDVAGYEVLSFGSEVDELPDLEDIQEDTSAKSGLSGSGGTSTEQKRLENRSGSGDVISRRTPRDDVLRPMGPRQELTKPQTKAEKAAVKAGGFVTGKVLGGLGAAIGMGVAGPLGAVAGGLLGNLAGGKLGAGIINDMRTNPQTMALPGKTTKPGPSRVAVPKNAPRSNPLMSPVTRAPLGPVGAPRSAASVVAPVSISAPPSVGPMPVDDLTFEDVDITTGVPTPTTETSIATPPAPGEPGRISSNIGFQRAVETQRPSVQEILRDVASPLNAVPVGRVDRSPLASVTSTGRMTPEEAERMAQSLPDIQLTEQQMAAFRDRMPARRSNPLMAQPARPAPRHNLPAAPVSPVTRTPMPSISPLPGVPVSGVARGVPLANVDPLTASPVSNVTKGVPLADVGPLGTSPVGKVTRGSPLADVGPLNAMPVERVDRGFAPGSLSPLTASPVSQVGRSALAPVAPSFNQPMNPANRAAPTYTQTPEGRNVPAPTLASRTPRSNPLFAGSRVTTDTAMVNPMTRTQSRQVMPSLDYDRFSRTKSPSVNWGPYNPDDLDPYTRSKVEEAQSKLGFSLNITSGFRDPARNKAAGGAKKSQHIHGKAVDISMEGLTDSQRADVVAALGSVAEPGKARIGAYLGNTGLHFDTAENIGSYSYGGVHGMFEKTAARLDEAPSWFSTGLQRVKDKDYKSLKTPFADPFSPEAIAATQPREKQTPTPSAYSNTPGAYTSSGMFNRDQKTKEQMGFTIAGELDGRTLRGLERNDPVARAELANVVATMENRAFSSTYKGDMNAVNIPSQYNSLMDSEIGVTRANWGAYGSSITKAIDDYYTGQNKPTMPQATHYANYDTVKPDWDAYATERQKVGYHTFSTVNLKDMDVQQYAPTKAFQAQYDKAVRDEVNKQTQVSFDIGKAAVSPVTAPTIGAARAQQPDQVTKPTTFSSTMTAGYPGATVADRTKPASSVAATVTDYDNGRTTAFNSAKGVMGAAKDGGPVGVSRTMAAMQDSWSGLRAATKAQSGVMGALSKSQQSSYNRDGYYTTDDGGWSDGFGSGTVSDSAKSASEKNTGGGAGLF